MPCIEEQTHLSIKNILLAIAPSDSSEATLPDAIGLARRYGSTMFVADVISPEAICEIVRNRQVDLLVIGTHGQTLANNTGSTTEEILRMVPCPVLIIGPRVTHTELAKGGLERIVYVTEFSTSSLDTLLYAAALAQDNGAQLALVHVAEETTMGPFYYGNSKSIVFRKRLESLVPARSGFLSEFVIGEGDRVEGLLSSQRT